MRTSGSRDEHSRVAREQERATQRRDHAPPPAVLLVEDDAVLSELVTTLVEGVGYQAVTIADHDQIGEAIDRFDPKCVILDGEIGRTGLSRSWDDAAAIRREHPALPVSTSTSDRDATA